jgi:YD repeat-containing protein
VGTAGYGIVQFTYDRAGRMLTALSGRYANTVTLAYDHAGRLASEGLTIAGQTYSVGRTYDVRGLEATLALYTARRFSSGAGFI